MQRKQGPINRKVLLSLHDESLAEHCGASGLRDKGLFDSALARPVNLAICEEPDVANFAASYSVGLAKNHAFVDGNKRAAFLSIGLFLLVNGFRLKATQAEATLTILDVAAAVMDEAALAQWIRDHIQAR
ncbi:type II toxin-antitoxin system death-on-curing family toxin [Rhodoferax antarcticus]|uniref:type II toxin-antitoxin system death-on-curing family toxin n=1 Tax=Rhodoferax antarcticus TaxID=81479 RepID=UPI00094FDFCA|nr:type II toxin-antitoxin system death-on-curing family toxin [Rhodoferax antarcticus]APW46400.1 death-on-curing protein [Rhodoferax antarcticus]